MHVTQIILLYSYLNVFFSITYIYCYNSWSKYDTKYERLVNQEKGSKLLYYFYRVFKFWYHRSNLCIVGVINTNNNRVVKIAFYSLRPELFVAEMDSG